MKEEGHFIVTFTSIKVVLALLNILPSGWRGGGAVLATCFSHQRISQRAIRIFFEISRRVQMHLEKGPIASREGSNCISRWPVPVFLRTPITTSDFPEGIQTPCPPTSGSTHVEIEVAQHNKGGIQTNTAAAATDG